MLAQDKLILATYKDYLGTEKEIDEVDVLVRANIPEADFSEIVISGDRRATLARFLWQTKQVSKTDRVPQRALETVQSCIATRQKHQMNELLRPKDPVLREFFKKYREVARYSFHSSTIEGYPIKFTQWGFSDLEFLEKAWKDSPDLIQKAEMRLWEYMTQVFMPAESRRQGRTVDRAVIAHDLTKVNVRHIYMMKCFLGKVSGIFRQVYPETIAKTIIYHAPWWISGPVSAIRLFMHPMARIKLLVEAGNSANLRDSVPADELPTFAGGTCSCTHCSSSTAFLGGLEKDFAEEEENTRVANDKEVTPADAFSVSTNLVLSYANEDASSISSNAMVLNA
eukprot:GEMP01012003.1.p1 GENE.GEMP01012003.1~~GEMP01012003.1.p1  ORF type:complete len:339 (+),score=58.03 GEMP01012003.1:87-1103(+)